ncbi:MAG: LCP family protein [Eubacteriales bacterium]|nr:LCP family protein [Eubacteriales bacterium]
MSYQGRYQNNKPQKSQKPQKPAKPRKKGGVIALVVLIVIIALLATAIGAAVLYYNHMLDKITTVEADPTGMDFDVLESLLPPAQTEETEPTQTTEATEATEPEKVYAPDDIVNIMLVGNSARPGEASRLADTSILVTINKYTKTISLNSVFRDTLVQFPKFEGPDGKTHTGGKIKFTTVYHLGWKAGGEDVAWAMKVQNACMEQNFGVKVDYNFEVDFDGFMELINELGGVYVELTQAEADYLNEKMDNYLQAEAGGEWLDGYAGLTYVRMRHAKGDNDSDIIRTGRQRYFLEQLFDQVKSKDLATLNAAVSKVLPYITTNMPKEEINALMLDLIPMLPSLKIESGTIPVEGSYWGDVIDIYGDGGSHSVLYFDAGQNKKVLMALTGDAGSAE